jgi:hypothetical protein
MARAAEAGAPAGPHARVDFVTNFVTNSTLALLASANAPRPALCGPTAVVDRLPHLRPFVGAPAAAA